MEVGGIILAAGLSSRMNAFKPLLQLNGKTMLEHCIDTMRKAETIQIVVVLGHKAEEVLCELADKYDPRVVLFVQNQEYAKTDMLASIKIGIATLRQCDAFFLLPGDMPAVSGDTLRLLREIMQTTNSKVVYPALHGYRKHPPLISFGLREQILNYNGDGGLREVLGQLESEIKYVPVQDTGCSMDADTREDYIKLLQFMEEKN